MDVDVLLEFCKRISEKEVAGESDSSNVVSNGMNSDREEVHLHHPFLVKNASGLPGGIVMNIRVSLCELCCSFFPPAFCCPHCAFSHGCCWLC